MRKHKIILVFIFTIYNLSLHPQTVGTGKLIKVISVINELEVTDSLLLRDIDSLVLNSNCPELEDSTNKYFNIWITKIDEKIDGYKFIIELFNIPIAKDTDMGYFEYMGYTFFVEKNELNKLFKKKKNKKRFSYMRGEHLITEEFPMWVFLYKNNRLTLVERSVCV